MNKTQFDALIAWVDAKIDQRDRAAGCIESYREMQLREELEKLLVTDPPEILR